MLERTKMKRPNGYNSTAAHLTLVECYTVNTSREDNHFKYLPTQRIDTLYSFTRNSNLNTNHYGKNSEQTDASSKNR